MRFTFAGVAQLSAVPRVAVVIDVMRAFTTAAYALAGSADRIVFAGTDDAALELKARQPNWLAVRDGAPAPGFDLSNSPGQLSTQDLRGRTLVMKTTAGTAGALGVADADVVLCASFVVAQATARLLRKLAPEHVVFVITGDNGSAEEDLACAQYIAALLTADDVDPRPFTKRALHSTAARQLMEGVDKGYRGVHPDDVQLCLEVDTYAFAMTATNDIWGMTLGVEEP
ncbi:2-phosphosulfolactate phosphatase [Nocardia sp. NPDC059691]|uniref:2-phosphosulfolactate phosphatase n=1 Tax=Nocardia sp. NPDC059691 TaxID=3346908 RepID=UPI003675D649